MEKNGYSCHDQKTDAHQYIFSYKNYSTDRLW